VVATIADLVEEAAQVGTKLADRNGLGHRPRVHDHVHGIAKISGGTLILVGEAGEGPTEGAITGGTGIYAGARGTFVSRPGRGASTTTVTLLEELRPRRALSVLGANGGCGCGS
jgi:hypothetical protein